MVFLRIKHICFAFCIFNFLSIFFLSYGFADEIDIHFRILVEKDFKIAGGTTAEFVEQVMMKSQKGWSQDFDHIKLNWVLDEEQIYDPPKVESPGYQLEYLYKNFKREENEILVGIKSGNLINRKADGNLDEESPELNGRALKFFPYFLLGVPDHCKYHYPASDTRSFAGGLEGCFDRTTNLWANIFNHETGHTYGLEHTSEPGDQMNIGMNGGMSGYGLSNFGLQSKKMLVKTLNFFSPEKELKNLLDRDIVNLHSQIYGSEELVFRGVLKFTFGQHMDAKDYEKAKEILYLWESLATMQGNDAELSIFNLHLSRWYFETGGLVACIETLEKSNQLRQSDYTKLYLLYRKSIQSLENKAYDQALKLADEVLELHRKMSGSDKALSEWKDRVDPTTFEERQEFLELRKKTLLKD